MRSRAALKSRGFLVGCFAGFVLVWLVVVGRAVLAPETAVETRKPKPRFTEHPVALKESREKSTPPRNSLGEDRPLPVKTAKPRDAMSIPSYCQAYSRYPFCEDIRFLPTGKGECGFNLGKDTRYLPDPKLLECSLRASALGKTMWARDAAASARRIRALQTAKSPEDTSFCDQQSWHVVKFTSHGHGVNSFAMAHVIGNHWDRNMPVLASQSAYRFGDASGACDGAGWSCHMSPLSETCTLQPNNSGSKKTPSPDRVVHYADEKPMSHWCQPLGEFDAASGRCRCGAHAVPSERSEGCVAFPGSFTKAADVKKWKQRWLWYHAHRFNSSETADRWRTDTNHWLARTAPGETYSAEHPWCPAYGARGELGRNERPYPPGTRLKAKHGFFWWFLHHIWIIHESAPRREEMEAAADAYLGPETRASGQCVAVHVRRGDSCDDPTARHRTCPPLEAYAKHVEDLFDRYAPREEDGGGGRRLVYLSTDDPTAVLEAKALMQRNPNTVWVWQNIDRKRYVNGQAVDNNPDLFQNEAVDELYLDLWAMSRCRTGLVASFSSSVAWNAYALMVGKTNVYLPFVSVDLPWGDERLGYHHAEENAMDGTLSENDVALSVRRSIVKDHDAALIT